MLKKVNDSDYLLVNLKTGKPFSQSALSKRLTKLFGFSVDMLRSIYLSDVTYNDELQKKLEKTAADMGSSVNAQTQFYVKDN